MATTSDDDLAIPVGPGGMPGRVFRFLGFLLTAGMMFPNVCVEGMNLSVIQRNTEGKLYAKT